MSKVVHLSEDAHTLAKEYCKRYGLKMSDWVAVLIQQAIGHDESSTQEPTATVIPTAENANVKAFVPKKKILERLDETTQTNGEGVPIYSQPPFWSRRASEP